jgi:hypothetical protein
MRESGSRLPCCVVAVALRAERASVAAKGRQIESEAAPIRYVAELLGADTKDSVSTSDVMLAAVRKDS